LNSDRHQTSDATNHRRGWCESSFGFVHLPDVWTAAVTVASGMAWSFIYYRYRLLLPLAFSHAALGSAFYYGIFGHDLAEEWRALLP
jgi:hypothetical protein